MNVRNEAGNSYEKNRIRDEIDAQIAEYLARGGEIDVVSTCSATDANRVAGVGLGEEEYQGVDG